MKRILIFLLLFSACNVGKLFESTEEESDGSSLQVCLVQDTTGRYFHGDFNRDGVPDSAHITFTRCW